MSAALDLDHFRDRLLEERKRAQDALEYLQKDDQGLLEDEHEEIQSDNHLADDATSTYDRELDATLEDNEERMLDAIDAALKRIDDGTYGICTQLRRAHPRGAAGGGAVGDAVHRLQAQGRTDLSESAPRTYDVRVGSSTDALTPVSVAERSLAARAPQWAGLGAVVLAAIAADQLTKLIVSTQLAFDESLHVVGPFAIHHVQNSGIAFGLFSSATPVVTALTALAVGWMLVYFARSGARHPVLPVALGLLIGGSTSNLIDRIRLGHVTDFLDLRYWPAFNLADSFIVVGVAILFVALLIGETRPR